MLEPFKWRVISNCGGTGNTSRPASSQVQRPLAYSDIHQWKLLFLFQIIGAVVYGKLTVKKIGSFPLLHAKA